MQEFVIAALLDVLLLPSLLLRYLPFKQFITATQKKHLVYAYGVWFVLLLVIDYYFLVNYGINIQFYKLTTMISWLPYLCINILLIPHHLEHHIFVAGMQCIYVMLVHGLAIFLLVRIFPNFDMIQFCYYQTGLYMLIFALTYPFIKNFFNKVFLARHAINNRAYWRSACLLPFLIVAGIMYLSYSNTILANQLAIPRLILLPTFICLIYAFSYDVQSLEDRASLHATNKFLSMQLTSLKEYSHFIEGANQKMAVIRHDIRHYNRLLIKLIQDGEFDAALKLITANDEHMEETAIKSFCPSPIINAALSLYISKAEQEQIPLSHKIILPSLLHVDENELAMLICNLLENAIQANYKQPEEARGIAITAKAEKNQLILAVSNRFDGDVPLSDDGLPFSNKAGHGLGTRALADFKEKYHATVLCSQKNGWFKIMIYTANEGN